MNVQGMAPALWIGAGGLGIAGMITLMKGEDDLNDKSSTLRGVGTAMFAVGATAAIGGYAGAMLGAGGGLPGASKAMAIGVAAGGLVGAVLAPSMIRWKESQYAT